MRLRSAFLVALTLVIALPLRSHVAAPAASSRIAKLPHITVWAWERRDDLTALDTQRAAVAQLVETITQDGPVLRVAPQRNRIYLPDHVRRMAVVRIETHQPQLTHGTATAVARELARISWRTRGHKSGDQLDGERALAFQVDFDALRSERAWYRDVLTQLRTEMPQDMPLSITALASWCSADRWMAGLPIDEAVPMLFRMEPGQRGDHNIPIREPLCAGSAGISTREDWPGNLADKRIYIFPDRGWRQDDLTQTLKALP
ncbi:MAG: DUF3142 domain-containing protein [Acidobacteria bacterium]|nr:DUF3142 domain-containing protein [Acidobacteriota bacterium]